MRQKNLAASVLGLAALLTIGCSSAAQKSGDEAAPKVQVVGEMKNVMRKGQLEGTIHLDTISNRQHLYGLGPVEYLAGELMILDGRSYKATVATDSTIRVEETFDVKAPFFGYAHVPRWREQELPENISNLTQLERYLDELTTTARRPFLFRLEGEVENAKIHVVNLPEGTKVSSPEQAHLGQKNYQLEDREAEIIGFFSKEHKAIFTHHDTYQHLHLLTADKRMMGHLDEVTFKAGAMKLYLPEE
ncbi:MAG: acetolactate decarboxylase [Hymenobacteraceae bacterium]|nr:acetolactate decarboxylase [Hymenobacteraceae bacterium]